VSKPRNSSGDEIANVNFFTTSSTTFTAQRSYASAVLGVVILSVCLSACQSITRML